MECKSSAEQANKSLQRRSGTEDRKRTKARTKSLANRSDVANRHRRLRWNLNIPGGSNANDLNSETSFEHLKPTLLHAFRGVWPESEMGRGKVVNRTWGGSPSDSSFFLPDAGEDLIEGGGSEQWLGNTRLHTFPGLMFEVSENGAVSALTVY